jgi:4-amino-4-deoxy-L-arabinose transferase-like glycosyltransferase
MSRFNEKYVLAVIILLGALLRFSGVFEGLPAVYNSTEQFLAKYTLKMAANRSLDPGFYIYPSLYQYFLLFLYGIYYLTGLVFGVFKDSYDFAVQYLINPSGIFLIGRIVNVVFSVITIWIIYKLARKNYSSQIALFAAAFMAFSYYIITFSRYAIHESFLVFFTVLAINQFRESLVNKSYKILFLAGLFSGLAIATKYNSGFLVFGLILSAVFSYKRYRDHIFLRLLYALSGLFVGFILTNPYWLLLPERYIAGFSLVSMQMNYELVGEGTVIYLWEIWQILSHEFLLGALFILSIAYAIYNRKQFNLILLSIVLPTFLYVGSWNKKGIDYLLVCWPPFILLATDFIDYYWTKIRKGSKFSFIFTSFVLLPLILFNVYQTILLILPDTRKEASKWLLANMNPNEKIYYDKNGYDLQLIDIRRYTKYGAHAKFLNDEIKNRLDSYKNIKRNVNFIPSVEYLIDLSDDTVFMDNQGLHSAFRWKNLNEILNQDVTWIVINEEFKLINTGKIAGQVPASPNQINSMRSFYSDLESKFRPVKVFKNSCWISGPEILIYKNYN